MIARYFGNLTNGRIVLWSYVIWYLVTVVAHVCMSSFAALVKDEGYVLVFPPSPMLNVIGFLLIATFVALALRLRSADARAA